MFMFCAYSKKYSLESFAFFWESPLSLVTGGTVPLVFFLFIDVDLLLAAPLATPLIPCVVRTGVTANATGPEAGVAKVRAGFEEAGVVEDDALAAAAGAASEDEEVAAVAAEDVDGDAVVAAVVGVETASANDFFLNSARAAAAAASPAAAATASLPVVAAASAAAFAAAASAASHAAAAARTSEGVWEDSSKSGCWSKASVWTSLRSTNAATSAGDAPKLSKLSLWMSPFTSGVS